MNNNRPRNKVQNDIEQIINETENGQTADVLKLLLEVLLDIRDTLYDIKNDNTTKWGSKL